MRKILLVLWTAGLLAGCVMEPPKERAIGDDMSISQSEFGRTPEGQVVRMFTCRNQNGLVLKLIDYGAIVVSFEVPDREGKVENVTLGFPTLDGYLERHPYFGATVGRLCNRIGNASFTLEGRTYQLAANDGKNHLHGGLVGFDKRMWTGQVLEEPDAIGVRFSYLSPDGEEGYPGNVEVSATYILTRQNELKIEFTAKTDRSTPINLTNHAYWNLAGGGSILDHVLTLEADRYLVVDSQLIPTGEIAGVAGTPFDLTSPQVIGSRLEELKPMAGYDHCFVLRPHEGLARAARVESPAGGRVMEIWTTQPAIQFYTGNFLDGSASAGGYGRHEGFCLETQHFPDSPNHEEFPSTILRPGTVYRQVTVHKFFTD